MLIHSIFLVFILVSFHCCTYSTFDGRDPGYIIAECDGGLSNRLRVLLSHVFLGKVLHNGARLLFVWDVNDACPGHFLQIFRPIPNVTFIDSHTKDMFTLNATKVYPKSRNGFEQTMFEYDVNFIVKKRTWWKVQLELWTMFKPTPEVENKIEQYVRENDVCNMTSMHIRKTDMELELHHKKRAGYDQYFYWVEKQAPNEPVFLITDNPKTQRLFMNKYGLDKIKVYKNISSQDALYRHWSFFFNKELDPENADVQVPEELVPVPPAGGNAPIPIPDSPLLVHPPMGKKLKRLALDRRFTTLEHAIIDIMIAAHAKDFRMSPFSSVSELVKMMNFLYRWKWCGCTFQGC